MKYAIKPAGVIVWALAAIIGIIFLAGIFPWYMQKNPMVIIGNTKNRTFAPGDPMLISFKRTAIIGFQAKVVRELVKINPASGAVEEVFKMSIDTSIGRGTKNIVLTYSVPEITAHQDMKANTYRWQGCMEYHPFGIVKKTFFFESEPFIIRIDKPGAGVEGSNFQVGKML